MARKKKTPVVSYGQVIPQTFGAAGDAIEQYVTFGIGTIDKIVSGSDVSVGLIAFGYNAEMKSGAIAIGGELVSSKILDVVVDSSDNEECPTITVKYLDSSTVQELTFNAIDPSTIERIDSSINNLYQELIDDEEVLLHYFTILNTSVNLNTEAIQNLKTSQTNVNSSINTLMNNYIKSIQPINSSAIVVNNITPSGTKGKQFEIGLVVDDNTVKIENGQLTSYGNTYTIKATSTPTEGFLKTYQLYQTNAAGVETEVANAKIDIPKDFVLKEVHLCKAVVEIIQGETVYTETAKITDSDFDQAPGDVYLHFTWQTKDSDTKTSETFIKVDEMAPVYMGDADTDPSTGKYITISNNHIVSFDSSKLWNDMIEPIDSSMQQIFTELINDEKVLVNYFSILDTSINNNTDDISTLKNTLNSTSNNIANISNNITILNSSVSNIEQTFVKNVAATEQKDSVNIVNSYTPAYSGASQVNAISVQDSSISYTITKTINGVDTEVVTINSVNPNLIEELATVLTDHSKRLDETEHKLVWINI